MNFVNNLLTINDDPEFGCTVEFEESVEDGERNLLDNNSRYLLIQRNYPEDDEYEMDWYSIETTETDVELSQKDLIFIDLKPDLIKISWGTLEEITIGLNLSDDEHRKLRRVLKERFAEKVVLK